MISVDQRAELSYQRVPDLFRYSVALGGTLAQIPGRRIFLAKTGRILVGVGWFPDVQI